MIWFDLSERALSITREFLRRFIILVSNGIFQMGIFLIMKFWQYTHFQLGSPQSYNHRGPTEEWECNCSGTGLSTGESLDSRESPSLATHKFHVGKGNDFTQLYNLKHIQVLLVFECIFSTFLLIIFLKKINENLVTQRGTFWRFLITNLFSYMNDSCLLFSVWHFGEHSEPR